MSFGLNSGPKLSPGRGLQSPTQSNSSWHWRHRLRRDQETDQSSGDSNCRRTTKMSRLEAALFVANEALAPRKLATMATLADAKETLALISLLNSYYDETNSAFRIERVAAGFKLLTKPHLANWLDRLHSRQAHVKLSSPAMETLTVVAYRQPCTRADVEAVRGVQAAEMIKQLLERSLIRVVGEDDSLGRPYLYGTTRLFLESFGLSSLDDLPMADTLRIEPGSSAGSDEEEPEEGSIVETDSSAA